MRRIPFKPTPLEYVECLSYYELNNRQVVNAAVALTHRIVSDGKTRLAKVDRSSRDYKLTSDQETLKYWVMNPPARINVDLTDDNYSRLLWIMKEDGMLKMADAVSYCLRTLRAYVDRHGTKIIIGYNLDEADKRRVSKYERKRAAADSGSDRVNVSVNAEVYNMLAKGAKSANMEIDDYLMMLILK